MHLRKHPKELYLPISPSFHLISSNKSAEEQRHALQTTPQTAVSTHITTFSSHFQQQIGGRKRHALHKTPQTTVSTHVTFHHISSGKSEKEKDKYFRQHHKQPCLPMSPPFHHIASTTRKRNQLRTSEILPP